MLRKSIPLYFMETRILIAPKVAVAGIVKNLKQDLWLKLLQTKRSIKHRFDNQSKLHSPRYKWRLTK
jgi:hypothetical protein